MFGKNINLPVYTNKIEPQFIPMSEIKWEDLRGRGIIKETIDYDDDDNVTIIKSFEAYDKSFYRSEKTIMSKQEFKLLTNEAYTKEELEKDIKGLEDKLNIHREAQEYEECKILKDRIDMLKELLKNVKD